MEGLLSIGLRGGFRPRIFCYEEGYLVRFRKKKKDPLMGLAACLTCVSPILFIGKLHFKKNPAYGRH